MKKISLVTKIGGGFGTVLILLFIVSLISWNGLSKITEGFLSYRDLATSTERANSLQTDMLNVQMNAKDFIISGNQHNVQRYNTFLTTIKTSLDDINKDNTDQNRAKAISTVIADLDKYQNAFGTVVELKEKRNALLNNSLNILGPQMSKDLSSIMDTAHDDQDEVASYLAGMALRNLLTARNHVLKFLVTNQQEDVDAALSQFKELSTYTKKMDILLQDDIQLKKNAAIKTASAEYIKVFQELVDLIYKRNSIVTDSLDKLGPSIGMEVENVKTSVKAEQDGLGTGLKTQSNASRTTVLVIAVIALIGGTIFAIFLTRAITGPILKTVNFAEKMAGGDFTQTLEIKQQDEIGTMAQALNRMIHELADMLKEVINGVNTLSTSSVQLKNVSADLSQGSHDTSEKSNAVAAAAEQMSINISNVANSMEDSANTTNLVASATEEMSATVNEISNGASKAREISESAVTQSKETSDKMKELGSAANEIGKVTETITDISEQTNLLALNATIEAARAGEAGKGFAVVANEIKELAKQTADATVDIKNQIDAMQNTTSSTVKEIMQISEVILEINNVINSITSAVSEQTTATEEIAGSLAQSSHGIMEINENISQSSSVVSDITAEISQVNHEAAQMAKNSEHVLSSADNLLHLSEQLKSMVAKFKV